MRMCENMCGTPSWRRRRVGGRVGCVRGLLLSGDSRYGPLPEMVTVSMVGAERLEKSARTMFTAVAHRQRRHTLTSER